MNATKRQAMATEARRRFGVVCIPGRDDGSIADQWFVWDHQATGSTRATAMPGMREAWREAQRRNREEGDR
jgi:hypothetical protein